jgi:hypothetical protein
MIHGKRGGSISWRKWEVACARPTTAITPASERRLLEVESVIAR